MGEVVPRWEWRAFGTDFGEADAKFAALDVEAVQESDETYFISPTSDETVKIRAGLMDIKKLVKTSDAGLEQWRPVMKQGFPIPLEQARRVCAELHVDSPASEQDALSLEEFLEGLSAGACGVRSIPVHKRRQRYTIGGCTLELTDVTADGKRVRTVAIESEDAERVVSAVIAIWMAYVAVLSGKRSTLGAP
jgi:exopolyphosphatase/guanosine-5'-triphosphate,3'-diphosphate pyrophosphatase